MDVYAIDFSNPAVNPLAKISTIGHLLNVILPTLIIGAAVLLLLMLLYGAFTWITAGGSSENVAKAQKIMTYAILGLVLVILSFVLVKLFTTIFRFTTPI